MFACEFHAGTWRSGDIAPTIVTLGTNWRSVASVSLLLGKQPPVLIEQEAGWTPETSQVVMEKTLFTMPEIPQSSII